MNKKRFFASLKYARETKFMTYDKNLRRLAFGLFQYAYTCGWNDRNNGGVRYYE